MRRMLTFYSFALLVWDRLLELVKKFYLGGRKEYDAVVAFNEDGDKFDFATVLRAAGIA